MPELTPNDQPSLNDFTTEDSATLALELVTQDLLIANTFSTNAAAEFGAGTGATIDRKVPNALFGRTRGLDDTTNAIILDNMGTATRPATLDTLAYNAVGLSVQDWNLDLENFGAQVLSPQAGAVAYLIEQRALAAVKAIPKTVATGAFAYSATNPQTFFTAVRKAMRDKGLPARNMVALVGTGVYADLINAKALEDVSQGGNDAALREGVVGRVKGFDIVETNDLLEKEVAFYHRNSFELIVRAPEVPRGAPYGSSVSSGGFAMTHIMQYDIRYAQDISLVETMVGIVSFPVFRRATAAEFAAAAAGSEIKRTGVVEVTASVLRFDVSTAT